MTEVGEGTARSLEEGAWVEVEIEVLPAGSRSPRVPADTARLPLVALVNGRLVRPSKLGDDSTIETPAGRLVSGRLRGEMGTPAVTFGPPDPAHSRPHRPRSPRSGRVEARRESDEHVRSSARHVLRGGHGAKDRHCRSVFRDRLLGSCVEPAGIRLRTTNEVVAIELRRSTRSVTPAEGGRYAALGASGSHGVRPVVGPPGRGARILLKDEAANASGSFKARRAALTVHRAAALGYRGVIAASSGNYGAAVASQAAMHGLRAIIVQECFDSQHRGQPEILEKTRACEAYGAEVWRLTVGPELFYLQLRLLEDTGFFNASLYLPDAILGIETLGAEIVEQTQGLCGKPPTAVIVTHAGGGNVTGTARGIAGATTERVRVIGASVDLAGLHMASDTDFNQKSFTTGHTGFGIPFAIDPDRSEVPYNAARALRYLDRYVTVPQGSVFLTTELLARLRASNGRAGTRR